MTKDQFVKAISPRLLELENLNIFKKKKDDESDHCGEKSDCEHSSVDYGDGPADWLFSPDKLRGLYRHGAKRYHMEIKEEKEFI